MASLAKILFYNDMISLWKGGPLPDIGLWVNIAAVPHADCEVTPAANLA